MPAHINIKKKKKAQTDDQKKTIATMSNVN